MKKMMYLCDMKTNNWKPLGELVIDDSVEIVHCDTRDFHCITHQNSDDIQINMPYDKVIDDRHIIPATELKTWLQKIQEIFFHHRNNVRLNFKNVDCGGWLKYIRCYRLGNSFIICNRNSTPIEWKNCIEENII